MKRSCKWLPVIDEEACTGCGLCVEACGPNCLGVVADIAMLLNAGTCGSEEHCIAVCPEDAIHMQWIPMNGDQDVGKWMTVERDTRSWDDVGLTIDDA